MVELSNFEKYNHKDLGKLYLIVPGLINSKTTKNLNFLPSNRDPQIILLQLNKDYDTDTFLELCIKLVREGFHVVLEYNDYLFDNIIQRNINYTAIVPNIDIVSGLRIELEKNYEEVKDFFVKYYFDVRDAIRLIRTLTDNTKYCLELMNPQFNIRQAISEYAFMLKDHYKYI